MAVIKNWLQFLLLLSFSQLILSCGDSHLMDKTVRTSSILRGEKVTEISPVFQRTALLVQQLEMDKEIPIMFGLCSSLVLNSRSLLTAAHCLQSGSPQPKVILKPDPRKGINPVDDVLSVVDSRKHPSADLAIIYLDRDLPINFDTKSFSDSDMKDEINFPNQMLITGYGRTSEKMNLTGISFSEINGFLKEAWIDISAVDLTDTTFSLEQKNAAGVCFGDSGGPAFIKTAQGYQAVAIAIGVSESTEKEIVCSGSGLYLNIRTYQNWIDHNQLDLQNSNN